MTTETKDWGAEQQAGDSGPTSLMARLPSLLRFAGTLSLIVAMYSFLIKGWNSGDDLFRYLLLLGHTGLMAIIGLSSGHWLKEGKGARLLLTLALVSVPVNFAILGAFIFANTPTASQAVAYPQYVAWTVDSLSTAWLTTAGAMLILLPVIRIGFLALARTLSRELSTLYLLGNAALLIPLRDPLLMGTLITGLILLTLAFTNKASHRHIAARTREGIMALGLQFLPMGILLGRSLWLYSPDLLLLTVSALTLFIALRQLSLRLTGYTKAQRVLEVLSLVPAVGTGIGSALTLIDNGLLPLHWALPICSFISAGLIYEISLRTDQGAKPYRLIAATLLCGGTLSNLFLFGGTTPALISIVIGSGIAIYGYGKQQQAAFASGTLLMLAGFGYQLYSLYRIFDLGGWISLATLGVAAIIAASMIETQGGRFKNLLIIWKQRRRQWEY